MGCPACQVIIWDDRAAAMLASASKLAELHLGGTLPLPAGWSAAWYEVVEEACSKMGPLLEQIGLGGRAVPEALDPPGGRR